ncbi:hypothetical protein [Pseudanabaena sp. PCC 6802]|uniref:hypothetical protein n=1 Tax=Pseudanabaena sp. PCC 6802 TaxID=118173 RepID=UPI0003681789|nr:hypothetical protein [Pseudanabaena sp. PCC 6802]
MERGLLWLPLLTLFIWLAWAGWNEYQKIEAYRRWAKDFDRHKYDIYAILGQSGDRLVWCKPARQQPIEQGSINFGELKQVCIRIDDRAFSDLTNLPETIASIKHIKTVALELIPKTSTPLYSIPFTDVAIALNWFLYLSKQLDERQAQTQK